jgi:hypothetical protein
MANVKPGHGGALRGPDGKFIARAAGPAPDATGPPKPKATPKRGAAKKRKGGDDAANPTALVQRVYTTIDGELTKLENQEGTSSQDRERASRALSQMVSSLEKAIEMQREITNSKAKGRGSKDKEALAHAEDLRRQIAERLERLNRKRDAGK